MIWRETADEDKGSRETGDHGGCENDLVVHGIGKRDATPVSNTQVRGKGGTHYETVMKTSAARTASGPQTPKRGRKSVRVSRDR